MGDQDQSRIGDRQESESRSAGYQKTLLGCAPHSLQGLVDHLFGLRVK